MRYLLDTHSVVWASVQDSRLGQRAHDALLNCPQGEALISDISLLEIAMLVEKERIRLSVPLKRYLVELRQYYPVLAIDPGIAAEAFTLPLPQSDPFDRVIVATARQHSLTLITRDRAIQQSGLVKVLW